MSIEEKRREGFEKFVVDFHRGLSLDCERHNDSEYPHLNGQLIYDDWHVQSAWAAWNAALDSVVIELEEAGDPEDFFYDFQVITRSGAVNAIESAGLKVKS